MPRSSRLLRIAALVTLLGLAALACGQAEAQRSRIAGGEDDATGASRTGVGADPREGLETGVSGGSDPTKTGSGDSLTAGVGSGSGGSDPTGTAQDTIGFDGTKSWEHLIGLLSGVLTSTYTATYAVTGNPLVRSVAVVNLPPQQAVTVTDRLGNRHWALFVDSEPTRTCMSTGGAWRCKPFDKDDYTRWVTALLTTGFSPTFLAGLLAPGLLAEGAVPAYSVGKETVLGRPATCITTARVDTWPGARVCVDTAGVPLTVQNSNLGTITMTSLSYSADPAAFSGPG
ncbi:MAG: hypothetical protein IT198_12250 [Acidimicrobiia bacterium]|nr:hypothetical protein [Acidimicrobiia bacterium]